MAIASILTPELREMLRTGDKEGLRQFCEVLHPASAADFLEELDVDETWQVLSHADPQRQAEIFQYLPEHKQREMVEGVGRERMARMIEEMSPDDRVDLLQTLDDEVVESLLPLVAQAERQDIRRLLSYPEDSAGAVMTTDYAWFPQDTTVSEALANLRLQAPDRETIYAVYILDDERSRRLVGVVTLEELIRAHPNAKLSEIMDRNVISVRVDEDKEDVARKLAHYDFIAIPVVDAEGRLVGIVTHDDVIDVLVEAATEDAHRMGGVQPLEENFLEAGFWTEARSRATWLTVLFACELLTVLVLSRYERTFDSVPALVFFLPLIIAAGGNSGGQSAALVVRALALGQVRLNDVLRVLWRELFQGVTLGALLGVIGYLVAEFLVRSSSSLQQTHLQPAMVAYVVALAVVAVVVWGTLIGSLLPLLWKGLGVDPAVTSNPFVASLVDVTGVAIYFTIASIFLSWHTS